jgi:serine/threonine-protein kinase
VSREPTDTQPTPGSGTATPRKGGRLGRYDLGTVLGHGAMATVFRARDSNLQREVALKVMNLAMAARAESGERFRREAQAVAAVKHRGIVEIFDFVGATDDEPAYIVSELIEGPTLRRFLDERRGRLLPESAALVALPIAEALGVAHDRGIVHRDIKPDNVMIDRGTGGHRVVVTDFGVAHITGLETMTATGALVGSPAYMSPEQARGHDIGPASDLWALGILLYEMATGHLPFTGKDPLTVISAIAQAQCKRPSQVSPYVSGAFDEVVMRCLKVAPGERHAGVGALADELRAFCRSAGLEDPDKDLRRLLAEPEAFEAELRPRIADRAVAAARRHARRGEFARALSELSRATSYVPRHAEAEKLIATISSRRRWLRVGIGLGTVAALMAGLVLGVPKIIERVERWRAEAAKVQQAPPPVVARQEAVKAPEPAPSSAPAAARGPMTAPQVTEKKHPPRSGAVKSKKTSAAPAAATTSAAPARMSETEGEKKAEVQSPATPEATPAQAGPPAAKPIEPAVAPTPAVVRLLVRNAMCDASLDDRSPGREPPTRYPNVSPGWHEVFCRRSGEEKVSAGRIRVEAGGSYDISIEVIKGVPRVAGKGPATRPGQGDPGGAGKGAPGPQGPR